MIRPSRLEVNVTSFAEAGRTFLRKAILECERIFFNNESDHTFAESTCEFCMNLSNRERSTLVLDKRFC